MPSHVRGTRLVFLPEMDETRDASSSDYSCCIYSDFFTLANYSLCPNISQLPGCNFDSQIDQCHGRVDEFQFIKFRIQLIEKAITR